ncbi:hypothetical protein DSECCO2_561920 [anaerobic digester metagenome]
MVLTNPQSPLWNEVIADVTAAKPHTAIKVSGGSGNPGEADAIGIEEDPLSIFPSGNTISPSADIDFRIQFKDTAYFIQPQAVAPSTMCCK